MSVMAKTASRYDIYLPLTFNDGRSIPDDHFDAVERNLLARFGGVTSQQRDFPLRGIWQGKTQLYFDQVIVMTVLDFRRRSSARFIGSSNGTCCARSTRKRSSSPSRRCAFTDRHQGLGWRGQFSQRRRRFSAIP
jgi:hypothetical protein